MENYCFEHKSGGFHPPKPPGFAPMVLDNKKNEVKINYINKMEAQLEKLKAENIEKAKTLKKLKAQQGEISFDNFIKNTMKKYNKPKPKKKRTFNNNLGNLFTKNFI